MKRKVRAWLIALCTWSTLIILAVLVAWRVRMGYWVSPGTILPPSSGGFTFNWQQDPVAGWSGGFDPNISADLIRRVLDDVGALGQVHTADYTMWGEGQAWLAQPGSDQRPVLCISYLDHRPEHGPIARRHEVVATPAGRVLKHHVFHERIAMFDEAEYLVVDVLGGIMCAVLPPWLVSAVIAAVWAMRRRSRTFGGLCPNCAYPTSGLVSPICPECGTNLRVSPRA